MSPIPEGYRIISATNIEEIEMMRNAWEGMQIHPISDIDHYLNVLGTRTNVIRPHVILVVHNERPVTLAVGRIEKIPFDLKFGYKKICSPTARSFTIVYGGLLGDLSKEHCALLYDEFMKLMNNRQVDLIRLNNLDVNSNMYHLVTTRPGILSKDHFAITNTHWRMSAPESVEMFLKSRSRKHRYWLQRLERVLEKDHPKEVKYINYVSDSELSKLFADAESIAKKTYQRGLQVGFSDSKETRSVLTPIAKKGFLRGYFIYIKNEPCAFWMGQQYENTFTLLYTGYDPALRKYELGTILFVKMLEDLCSLGNIKLIDFGFGEAPYKSRFGDHNWQEATIHIFSSNIGGLKINTLRMLTIGGYRLSVGLLKRFNLLDKAKRSWRQKVIAQDKKDPPDEKQESSIA